MKVLLTGGTGYIGSHAAVTLIEAGHEVVCFDNLCNSRPDVISRIEQITNRQVAFVKGDIRDTALLETVLRDQTIEAVMHFAGLKAVGESVSEPLSYYDNNVQGTLSLLKAMVSSGLTQLVFSSSATVYGDPQSLPICEVHPTSATNPYGRTKLVIEEMLRDFAHVKPDWRIAILRYFNPAGAHPSGLIGEDPAGPPNNLMPYVSRVAAGRLPELSVFGDDYDTPDGTGVRDYVHVMDLVEGHLAALLALANIERPLSVWNLGTGRGFSVLELIRAFEKVNHVKVPYRITPRRPGDIAACYASVAKAERELGWRATRGLEEMCASAWAFECLAQGGAPMPGRAGLG